jgi:hypothetical protein
VRIAQLPPTLRSVTATRTTSGLEVRIVGYSTPRQITQATFRFAAGGGVVLQPSEVTVQLDNVFTNWYKDASSAAYGSQFQYVQPFALQGDPGRITSVTVTLSNGSGASQTVSANF